MCTCDRYPVEHHAGWCRMPDEPTAAEWRTFSLFTLPRWAQYA